MRDEVIRKVRFDVSSKKKTAPVQSPSLGNPNCRPQKDKTKKRSPEIDEGDHSRNKPVNSTEETWPDEDDQFTTEPRFFSRKMA